ncbi:DinB family protein [Novipirellula artificiosorum]|uniref:DinB superfamily protein n=1 Tax=Novipirellula artificiosorum TaxID=2528016 RepID=A0A5C6E2S0_9BACT|nr:DinB family protein [Novipirellula artificiosorum]TWU41911.1 DinB superfamily protein [Novipirellula artificiosorum]
MQAKDAIRSAMNLSNLVYKSYLSDFEDAELMCRPGPGCNHMAWQTGHLIASEVSLLSTVFPKDAVELPQGFAEAHSKETAESDDPAAFLTKQEYMSLMETVREQTLAVLDRATDEELSAASPEAFRTWCPTVGDMFVLIGSHPLMHAGQIVPIRRQLGKPVLF